MSLGLVQNFLDQSGRARTLVDLGHLLEAASRDLGFDYYALVQHVDIRKSNNQQAVWLENYPSSWAEVFIDTGLYASDPIHIASQRTSAGFVWSDVGQLIRLNAHHRRVLESASREGMGDGFTVPAHVPGDSNGTCSFGVKVGHALPRESLMAAQLLGTLSFEAARRLVRTMRAQNSRPRLTPRQLDCLVFVSRGKSDWEIAKILGVKESTVRSYIEEACERYDVRRRIQLVVRALHDGQLLLSDTIG